MATKKVAVKKKSAKKKISKKKSVKRKLTSAEKSAINRKNKLGKGTGPQKNPMRRTVKRREGRSVDLRDDVTRPDGSRLHLKEQAELNKLPPRKRTSLTPLTQKEKLRFLELVAEHGVVKYACEAVNISRVAAYYHKKKDPEFSKLWDEAIENSIDEMEAEAKRRATGYDRQLTFQGRRTGDTIRDHSDVLLMFMLKGNRPNKFRDNVSVQSMNLNINAEVDHAKMTDEQLADIAGEAFKEDLENYNYG